MCVQKTDKQGKQLSGGHGGARYIYKELVENKTELEGERMSFTVQKKH